MTVPCVTFHFPELAAEFLSRPHSQEVVEGEKAEFTCSVSKDSFEVKWFKDNKELEAGDKYQMVADGKRRTMVIKACELRDEGGYVVMIGETRASADLTVLGKPRPLTPATPGVGMPILNTRNPHELSQSYEGKMTTK